MWREHGGRYKQPNTYRCWKKSQHSDAEDGEDVKAHSIEAAVEAYAENRFYRDSYPEEQEIEVLFQGKASRFRVRMRSEPVFTVEELK